LNGTVLKTVIRESVSGVRIPELPQNCKVLKLADKPSCLGGGEHEIG
jgi:hypothetical protein